MRLKKLRTDRGISQYRLSELSGVSQAMIGYAERGQKNLTVPKAEKIAKALGCTLQELYEDEPSANSHA